MGFYGFAASEMHSQSWALLNRLCGCPNTPWLVGGDFNSILANDEKVGGRPKSQSDIDNFRRVVDSCGMLDLGFVGDPFTWCNR